MLEAVLECAGVNIDATTTSGETALMLSAGSGRVAACQILLAHGADISKRARNGATALLMSVMHCHYDVAEHLLAEGASMSDKSKQGTSALNLIKARKDKDVIKRLEQVQKRARTKQQKKE